MGWQDTELESQGREKSQWKMMTMTMTMMMVVMMARTDCSGEEGNYWDNLH